MNPITVLLTALAALSLAFTALWARAVAAARRTSGTSPDNHATDGRFPSPLQIGVGFVTNFFDALGIGSFATTTTLFRWLKMVPDRIIPGTLNAGHTLPTVVQAFIFTKLIPVDVLTLISMIAASVLGAWLGAGVVAKWPRRKVQIGMGVALLAAAVFMLMRQLSLFPPGGEAIGVRGALLAAGIGGVFGSYIAAKFFESLNIRTVRWLVIVVVIYTAVTMLLAARLEQNGTAAASAKA
jgi:uncharacterized membrane protein YfcA